MEKDFSSDASYLAWQLFKNTGEIGYYCLYANIENPPTLINEYSRTLDDGGRSM